MRDRQFIHRITNLYLVSTFGTIINAFASFAELDRQFNSMGKLGVALSLKTIFLTVLSGIGPKLVQRLGLKHGAYFSQVLGLFGIAVLALSAKFDSFYLFVAGICLSGLPGLLFLIFVSTEFRLSAASDDDFRSLQGQLTFKVGLISMAAGLSTPFLLDTFGYSGVLIIDACTYVVAAIGILLQGSVLEISRNEDPVATIPRFVSIFGGAVLAAQIAGIHISRGLLPIVASQEWVTPIFDSSFRRQLWFCESLAGALCGFVYQRWPRISKSSFIRGLASINCLFILLFFLVPDGAVFNLVLFFTTFFALLGYSIIRDNFISCARTSLEIATRSSFSLMALNLTLAGSPLLITFLLSSSLDFAQAMLVLFGFQLVLYCSSKVSVRFLK